MSNERTGRQLGRVSDGAMTTISRYVHLFIVCAERLRSFVRHPRLIPKDRKDPTAQLRPQRMSQFSYGLARCRFTRVSPGCVRE
jgi:hypothetical protein